MTKNLLLTILFFALTFLAQAQKNYGETVNAFSKAFPYEKIYIPPDKQDINSPIALDYRSTIYWNPSISTDDYGRALVSFPLSEGATTVYVDVQGISDNGQAFHGKMEFTVKSKH